MYIYIVFTCCILLLSSCFWRGNKLPANMQVHAYRYMSMIVCLCTKLPISILEKQLLLFWLCPFQCLEVARFEESISPLFCLKLFVDLTGIGWNLHPPSPGVSPKQIGCFPRLFFMGLWALFSCSLVIQKR